MGSRSSSSHQLRTQGLDGNGTTLVARLQFFGAGWKMVLLDPLQKLLECGPAGIWPGLSFPLPSHVVNSPVTGLQTQLASLLGSFPELGFLGLLTDFSYLACSPMACGNILCQQGMSLNRGAQCLPFTWVSPGNLQKEHFTLRTNFSFVFSPGPEPKGWVCPHSEWVFLARLPFLKTLSQTHPKVFLLVTLNPATLTIKVNDQKPQLENNLNVHSQTVG